MRVLPTKPGFLDGGMKTVATVASTGAAIVSIVTFLHAWGIVGDPTGRASMGNFGAKWIGVRPSLDTARTVGDTLHLAATITDKNGSILVGAHPTWTTENPAVATVEQDGSVVARGPGAATIIAVAGEVSARSRIVVHQTVAAVRIAGDSAIAMAEGDSRPLEARAFDARGYVIPGRAARWTTGEASVLSFDSSGAAVARDAGRAIVNATIDGIAAQALVVVAPAPAALAMIKGEAQHASAGSTLPERVVVRVVNHRGRPVEGTLVRFRTDANAGVVDPAAVVTDADGRARTTWSLGALPGRQYLNASVERVDSAIVVTAEADPVAANTRLGARTDSLRRIVASVDTVRVLVTDSTGRALGDVPVTWSSADGSVKPLAKRTDSLGEARAEWTLGAHAGAQHLRARVAAGVPALTLTALAVPSSAASISLARVKGRHASSRDVQVQLLVVDRYGNPVPGAAARLHARHGAVAPATVTTDSLGRAESRWTLSDKAGEQLLVASIKGAAADTLAVRAPRAKAQTALSRSPRP